MKKLIVWCVVLCSFGRVYAQDSVVEARSTVDTRVAVNTMVKVHVQADPDQNDDSRVKNISKTFPADQNDKISLSNQYGAMVIKVWDRKEVKIDVTIRANSGGDTQKLIDQVNIVAGKSGDLISCKTDIDNERRWGGRSKSRELKIDYVVYLPAVNALTLSQQFGNVTMGDYSGPVSANVQYGNFDAGNLSSLNNYVYVQYGKTTIAGLNKATIKQEYGAGLSIGTAGTLDVDAQYVNVAISTIRGNAVIKQQYGSGLKIGTVNNLDLNVEYANVNVGAIRGNATIKQEYNDLTIASVGKLNLRAEYAGVNIGTLRGDGHFNLSYNKLNIATVGTGCKSLTADVEYVDVNLGFAEGYNANFNVVKSYGGFRYGSNVRVSSTGRRNEDDDSSTKNYSGTIGSGGSSEVRIKAEYGSVVFK
ncbi:hypothetical protein [Pedobacter sp. L105]|uniref:hypothetical protein n=1 Tax=Pedobacter sp. L105 TaxID=1641871 RepID=UPI00131B862F|nr:hypothetical protein [Pedobacter sp. L105]